MMEVTLREVTREVMSRLKSSSLTWRDPSDSSQSSGTLQYGLADQVQPAKHSELAEPEALAGRR